MSERVAALIDGPLDAWDTHLCDMAETMTEADAELFSPIGAFAEGTWPGTVAARLRLQDLNPKYLTFDVLER